MKVQKVNFQFTVYCFSSEDAYYVVRKDDIYHETNNNNEDFCHYSSSVSFLLLRFSPSVPTLFHLLSVAWWFSCWESVQTRFPNSVHWQPDIRVPNQECTSTKPQWWKEISCLQSLLKGLLTDEGIYTTICTIFNEPHYLKSCLLILVTKEFPHFFFTSWNATVPLWP